MKRAVKDAVAHQVSQPLQMFVSDDIEFQQTTPPQPQAEDYIRISREDLGSFRKSARGRLIATERTAEAGGSFTAAVRRLRLFLTGRPLDTEALETERLSIRRALPILSSDALSSVAYGPEAGLAVLATAGSGALLFNIPIGIAIAILMIIVTTSYRQVVRGYQGGGGSYAVARANLGVIFGMVAAAALLVDYILTVAVSVSSGVAALSSAFASLAPYKILIGLALVVFLVIVNLRGVRQAGGVFAGPTYFFIVGLLVLIVTGLIRGLFFGHHAVGQYAVIKPESALAPLLILTAFAAGSSSMTGIEAVSNSVPSFEAPEAENAARTLTILGSLLVILFLGVVVLDVVYGAEPHLGGNPTVLSQIAAAVFEGPARPAYYLFQFATLLVLVLAANTSFNGFPRLSAILAHDHFLPDRFAHLGDRLVYSTGIIFLALTAAALMVVFQANTDSLIDLYALGVFAAFTLAQLGMARHWWRERGRGWRRSLIINGSGAVITAVVDAVIIVTKSPRGAWIVLIVVPLLVLLFWFISRYYASVQVELAGVDDQPQPVIRGLVVVPIFQFDAPCRAALRYAMALSQDVVAVHQARDDREASQVKTMWSAWRWPAGHEAPRLYTNVSDQRGRLNGFLAVLDRLQTTAGVRSTTVVVPEWEAPHPLRGILARPELARLQLILWHRPDVITARIATASWEMTAPDPPTSHADQELEHVAIVPITDLDLPARRALSYAVAVASRVVAVHVETGVDEPPNKSGHITEQLLAWKRQNATAPVSLVVIESPYRSVVQPLLAYIDIWRHAHPGPLCTVVLPELVVDRWWASWLHNHRAFWLKAALLSRPAIAVADVTYHLRSRSRWPSSAKQRRYA